MTNAPGSRDEQYEMGFDTRTQVVVEQFCIIKALWQSHLSLARMKHATKQFDTIADVLAELYHAQKS